MDKGVKSHSILINAEECIKTRVMYAEKMPQKSQQNPNQFPDTRMRTMLLMLQMKKYYLVTTKNFAKNLTLP